MQENSTFLFGPSQETLLSLRMFARTFCPNVSCSEDRRLNEHALTSEAV